MSEAELAASFTVDLDEDTDCELCGKEDTELYHGSWLCGSCIGDVEDES